MAKVYSGSIYFLGQYRPAYFEAKTLGDLRAAMCNAIENLESDTRFFLDYRIHNVVKQLRKPSCVGASAEHGAMGVSVGKRPHDPWLDNVVAKLPEYPGLAYPA